MFFVKSNKGKKLLRWLNKIMAEMDIALNRT